MISIRLVFLILSFVPISLFSISIQDYIAKIPQDQRTVDNLIRDLRTIQFTDLISLLEDTKELGADLSSALSIVLAEKLSYLQYIEELTGSRQFDVLIESCKRLKMDDELKLRLEDRLPILNGNIYGRKELRSFLFRKKFLFHEEKFYMLKMDEFIHKCAEHANYSLASNTTIIVCQYRDDHGDYGYRAGIWDMSSASLLPIPTSPPRSRIPASLFRDDVIKELLLSFRQS